jgi:outer membrane protein TolC
LRESSGELIRSERLNLEVELASRQQDRLSQQHESEMMRIRMAYLLGLPAGESIELADEDASFEKITYPNPPGIETRPELLAAEALAQAATEQVRSARSGRLPKMDAYASWQADKGWRREGSGTSWTAGLSLRMDIFDGWATRSRIGAAMAKERAAAERVRKTRLHLQMELEQAMRIHELAKGQKAVAVKQVEQSREVARLSRNQFAEGTLLSTELIGVESRLVEAEAQLALATSREWISLARLRRVSGHRILF